MDISSGIQASLSGRYATALFELARDGRQIDAVSRDIDTISALLHENEDFRRLTQSPLIGRKQAGHVVGSVADRLGIGDTVEKFLGLLARNGRLRELAAIIRAYRTLVSAHRGETHAEVISAHPLDAAQMGTLKDRLRKRFGRDVAVDAKVDPTILGGLIVRTGSLQIDGSIATKLNALGAAMKG